MSDQHDPLEKELRALRPRDVSIDLHVRIENELARKQRASTAQLRWLIAASILLWMGVGAYFYFTRELRRPETGGNDGQSIARVNTGVPASRQEQSLPTLAAYRQAFTKSPETLEALLDRPAVSTRAPPPLRWGDALRTHSNQPF